MAYSNFTIEEVELQFDLQLQAIFFLPKTSELRQSSYCER
jgi:hypothetical protein